MNKSMEWDYNMFKNIMQLVRYGYGDTCTGRVFFIVYRKQLNYILLWRVYEQNGHLGHDWKCMPTVY